MPEFKNNIGMLQTPVISVTKKTATGEKITNWYYSLHDEVKLKNGETASYKKGLGSWDIDELKTVIKKDGLGKMIDMLEFDEDADKIIDEWMGNDSEPRKKHILNNDFSITKL